jgi:hypothetical protein
MVVVALAGLSSLVHAIAEDPPELRGRGRTAQEEVILLELFTSQG